MTRFSIPLTVADVLVALESTGRTISQKRWERAAMVYAITYEPGTVPQPPGGWLCSELAERQIFGLMSPDTVYRYRRNWQWAIDNGMAQPASLGQVVTLPTIDYPANSREKADGEPSDGIRDNLFADTPPERQREAIQRVLERNPTVAALVEEDFVEKAAHDSRLMAKIEHRYAEEHPIPVQPYREPGAEAMFFGNAIAEAVRLELERGLHRVVDFLRRRHQENPILAREEANEEIEDLERAVTLIRDAQTELRQAVGVNVDATFARLVGQE